jgi:hypothetical protein
MPGNHGAPHDHAVRAHEQSAERHPAAAARWEERGDVEWAEFKRRCAMLEDELAQLGRSSRYGESWIARRCCVWAVSRVDGW